LDAHRHGLVDTLGGLERAVEEVVALTPTLKGLARSEIDLRFVTASGELPPAESSELGEERDVTQAALAELVGLLRRQSAALYYAPTPKLGA
jgi:hypothetical protein